MPNIKENDLLHISHFESYQSRDPNEGHDSAKRYVRGSREINLVFAYGKDSDYNFLITGGYQYAKLRDILAFGPIGQNNVLEFPVVAGRHSLDLCDNKVSNVHMRLVYKLNQMSGRVIREVPVEERGVINTQVRPIIALDHFLFKHESIHSGARDLGTGETAINRVYRINKNTGEAMVLVDEFIAQNWRGLVKDPRTVKAERLVLSQTQGSEVETPAV